MKKMLAMGPGLLPAKPGSSSMIYELKVFKAFILEELRGIFDPSGGFFKEGKYMHSFYAEVADVIEQFFFDVGILEKPEILPKQDNGVIEKKTPILANDEGNYGNSQFKICPECSNRTLKMEAGCDVCVGADCGYSKCDK